jgi:hypothetical protein
MWAPSCGPSAMWAPSCGPSAVSLQPATCALIHADSAVAGDDRRNPTEVRGCPAQSWFQHDRGAARSGAVQVQPVPTHVNELAGHGIVPRVERLAHSLVAAAYRGNTQRGQYDVDQPPCASAAQLPPARRNIQTTSPNSAGGHTQLSRSCTEADPLSEARPATPINAAGATAHRWGSVNRTDSTANNAQPKAKPSKTAPVRTFSSAVRNGAATRTRAATRPLPV